MHYRMFFLFWMTLSCTITTAQRWTPADYEKWDHTNFRQDARFRQSINTSAIDYPLLNAAIFFMTNEQRVQNNIPPMRYHPRVEIAAFNHSYKMATTDFFSHTNTVDASRASTSDRGKLAGIANPAFAENIAYNYSSSGGATTYMDAAAKLIDQWMNSPGHRSNILSTTGRQMGCGAYYLQGRFYGTQCFQWFNDVVETAEPPVDKAPWEEPFASNSAPTYTPAPTANYSSTTTNSTTNTTTNNTVTTTTTTQNTNTPPVTKESKKRYTRKHSLLTIKLGGALDAPLGNPAEYKSERLSGHAYGMLGVRIRHEGRVSSVGAWGNFGKYASAAIPLMSEIGNEQSSADFRELELGMIYGEWFRLSGGTGSLHVVDAGVATSERYTLGTLGFCMGGKSFKFEISNSFIFTGTSMIMRPSVGMAIKANFLKIGVK